MKINRTETVEKIRAVGMTVTGWARVNGFNHNTVSSVLSNLGTKWMVGEADKITKKLKSDGFLVVDEETDNALVS